MRGRRRRRAITARYAEGVRAVITGARGSGKTALADVIAAGCDAISPQDGSGRKGQSILPGAGAQADW
jgi:hypothetical protein